MEIRVTDHALIRYCERVMGLSFDAQRRKLIELAKVAQLSGAKHIVAEGHRFVISSDGAIVTAYQKPEYRKIRIDDKRRRNVKAISG